MRRFGLFLKGFYSVNPVKCSVSLFSVLIFALTAGIGSARAGGNVLEVKRNNYVADELLIKFRPNVNQTLAGDVLRNLGAQELQRFKEPRRNSKGQISRWRHVRIPPGRTLNKVMDLLRRNPAVETVEPNYRVQALLQPNDPSFSSLWGLHNIGQTGGTADSDVDAPEAWDVQTGGQNVVVAVIDTGVDYNHEDIAANIWTNPGEIPANGIDDDGNGYIDDVYGYDFYNNDGDPMDDNGHGTHVAGTIAARGDNGVGIVGVSWRASIMGAKFLSAGGGGFTSGAIQAVLYAANNGAKVMNNSWGGGGYSQALKDAIDAANDAGALFVAAAGNGGSDGVGDNNDTIPHYPSSYDVPNLLAVAATNHSDQRAGFSNYGSTSVDLGAPGVSILSTVPATVNATGYATYSGTSMATPHVSGAATLVFSQFPGITHLQVKNRLMSSIDPIPALQSITVTSGRLNVAGALASDATPPSPVTDLAVSDTSSFSLTLEWSATGDNGLDGVAMFYELRYSTAPINEANFSSANLAGWLPVSGPAGTPEAYTISGLESGQLYYVALKVLDDVGRSPLSNVATGSTQTPQVLFNDHFESGTGNWTIAGSDGVGGASLWHLAGHRVGSPINAFYYGIDATLTYNTGARNYGSITSVPINLTSVTGSTLTFQYFLATEASSNYDKALVQVSTNDGVSWVQLAQLANVTQMTGRTLDLSAYDGQTIRLRFFFDTIDSALNNYEGWVVDDVAVFADPVVGVPVADAGPDQVVAPDVSVDLDGAGSNDPDGVISSYAWSQASGTAVTLLGANTATPSFTAPNVPGLLMFQLTVTDNTGNSASDSVTVRVNQSPVADAGPDQTVIAGGIANLDGTGSSDSDGSIASYSWVQTGGVPVVLTDANTATPGFTAPGASETLTFELTVSDNDGASASDNIVVTVNEVPTADAGPDQSANIGSTVNLDGTASTDPDGFIASYSWLQTGGTAVTLTGANTATPSFTAPGASATLTFELTVTDDEGASDADTVVITVNGGDGGASGGGGGCTLSPMAEFDPLLPILLMLATMVMWRRRRA